MKILYISNPNTPLTRVWVDWFADNGHEVAVVADTPVNKEWPGRQIFDLPRKFNTRVIRYFFWAAMTKKIINQWHPDILHAHRVSSAGWVGAFTGFHPLVVSPWGSDLFIHPARSILAHRLAKLVLQKANLVTLNSINLKNKAIELGANPDLCKMISWGADLNTFYPAESTRFREGLEVGDSYIVLSPRGVKPIYNLDVILDSIPIVLKSVSKVIYFIQDYNTDIEYKQKLMDKIKTFGISNYIRWLPFQESKKYVEFFRVADIVLSIPSSDSMPITVLEALACGAPVIISDVPSLHEIIENNVNGMIVPIRDATALASTTIDLLNNKNKRDAFSKYNIEWVKVHANRDLEMKKMENLYFDLLQTRH